MLQIKYRPLKGLVPYAQNARTHSRGQIQKLKASLGRYGWTTPMCTANVEMLTGHGRLMAALEMAEEGIEIRDNDSPWHGPTVDLSHLTKSEQRAYILADNRLASEAGWDDELLRNELADLREEGYDLALTGFDIPEIGSIMTGWNPDMGKIENVAAEDAPMIAVIKVKCGQAQADGVRAVVTAAIEAAGLDGVEVV